MSNKKHGTEDPKLFRADPIPWSCLEYPSSSSTSSYWMHPGHPSHSLLLLQAPAIWGEFATPNQTSIWSTEIINRQSWLSKLLTSPLPPGNRLGRMLHLPIKGCTAQGRTVLSPGLPWKDIIAQPHYSHTFQDLSYRHSSLEGCSALFEERHKKVPH